VPFTRHRVEVNPFCSPKKGLYDEASEFKALAHLTPAQILLFLLSIFSLLSPSTTTRLRHHLLMIEMYEFK
jgi:hypothetical protein